MLCRVVSPPTLSLRSLPPTPIPWETPAPMRASSTETSCSPVPDADTMPTFPRGTALAKAIGTPARIAVPQSGPMTNSPRALASRLSATSSSSDTLSLKIMTLRPLASALRASRAANCPGTEINARFASCISSTALTSEREWWPRVDASRPAWLSRRSKTRATRDSAVVSSSMRSATIRSLAPASLDASASSPASLMICLLAAVPIMSTPSSTPSSATSSADNRIRATESR